MESEGSYDAIVIGAGLSGLTVGNILLYNGYKTLIIDKNHQPGGCVINFTRGDFRFDSATHFINGCGDGGMINTVLKAFKGENLVEFLPIKRLVHWVDVEANDGKGYVRDVPVDMKEYEEFLVKEFPHEEKGIRKFIHSYSGIQSAIFGFFNPGMFGKIRAILRRMKTMMRFFSIMFKSVDQVLRKYVSDPTLIEMMTMFTLSFGYLPADESFMIWMLSEFSYRIEGAWYPKGGAGEFTGALARNFEAKGGKILLNHDVTLVDVNLQTRMAEAVVCKDKQGAEHRFTSTVVVNTSDLARFATKLVPPGTFSPKWIEKVTSRDTVNSLVMVYLGLDFDVNDRGIPFYELWQVKRSIRTREFFNNMYKTRDYSQIPMEIVTIYSNGPDKTCCPPGKTCLMFLAQADLKAWEELLEDGKKGQKYRDFKKKVGDQFVARLAQMLNIPDLANHVEKMEVATPITLSRYTYAKNGTPIGYAFTIPSLKKSQTTGTRVKNLTLGGHFVFPGGGMSAVLLGGLQAAWATMKRLRKFSKHKNESQKP